MDLDTLHQRPERPYDQQGTSKVICRNGTIAEASDRDLCAALVRAVLGES